MRESESRNQTRQLQRGLRPSSVTLFTPLPLLGIDSETERLVERLHAIALQTEIQLSESQLHYSDQQNGESDRVPA